MRISSKVILFGEHSVVYGYRAISMPLSYPYTNVEVKDSENSIINLKNFNIRKHISECSYDNYEKYSFGAINILSNYVGKKFSNYELIIESEVPISCGLGSSAGVCVGTIKALNNFFNLNLSLDEIANLAWETEKLIQGKASPTDTFTITFEKPLLIKDNSAKLLDEDISKFLKSLNFFVVYVEKRKVETKDLVQKVSQLEFKHKIFHKIEEVIDEFFNAVAEEDIKKIGECMIKNHNFLKCLGVSTEKIDFLVDSLKKVGVYSKLTGAGGGGCCVCLVPDDVDKQNVIELLEKLKSERKIIDYYIQ